MTDGSDSRPASGYLSEMWFEALTAQVRSAAAQQDGDGGLRDPFRLGVRITDVPWAAGGELAYTVVAPGGGDVVAGSAEGADVVLVESYAAARSLAEGSTTVRALLEAGAIKIAGDIAKLMNAGELLSVLTMARDGAGGGGGGARDPHASPGVPT